MYSALDIWRESEVVGHVHLFPPEQIYSAGIESPDRRGRVDYENDASSQ
jgi:hypothetical protein